MVVFTDSIIPSSCLVATPFLVSSYIYFRCFYHLFVYYFRKKIRPVRLFGTSKYFRLDLLNKFLFDCACFNSIMSKMSDLLNSGNSRDSFAIPGDEKTGKIGISKCLFGACTLGQHRQFSQTFFQHKKKTPKVSKKIHES